MSNDAALTPTKTPCPRCRHGKKGGHSGRQCIAMVYERHSGEWDYCGCTHDQREGCEA